ncbi:GPI inositol deacylase [Entophlyctis sp. JEL0112]|nr:GPI inositol deacylase [Entophlyctis sp. JEL0112]
MKRRAVLLTLTLISIVLVTSFWGTLIASRRLEDHQLTLEAPVTQVVYAGGTFALHRFVDCTTANSSEKRFPVLFLHGHAGSQLQMQFLARKSCNHLDWFAISFNEQFSALDAHLLIRQAQFANTAIAYIQSHFDRIHYGPITLVGHSMGGMAASTLLSLPNFPHDSVGTVLNLATPLTQPPVSIEFNMVLLYYLVNKFLVDHFSSQQLVNDFDLVTLSVAGGSKDLQIQSHFTDNSHMISQENGFSVYTSSVPYVWKDLGHDDVLSNENLVDVLAEALILGAMSHSKEERYIPKLRT